MMVDFSLEKYIEELLADLVAYNSVNPKWEGGSGEASVCDHISGVLSSLGFIPVTQEVAP